MISQAFRLRNAKKDRSIACLVVEEAMEALDDPSERLNRMDYINTLLDNDEIKQSSEINQRIFVMRSPIKLPGGDSNAFGHDGQSAAIQSEGQILVSNKYSRAKINATRLESKTLRSIFSCWYCAYLAHRFRRMHLQSKVMKRWKRFLARKMKRSQTFEDNVSTQQSRQQFVKQSAGLNSTRQLRGIRSLPNVLIVESLSLPATQVKANKFDANQLLRTSSVKSLKPERLTPVRARNKSLFGSENNKQKATNNITPCQTNKEKSPTSANKHVISQSNLQPPTISHSPPPPSSAQQQPTQLIHPDDNHIKERPVEEVHQIDDVVSSLSSLSVVETAQRKDLEQIEQQHEQQQHILLQSQQQSPPRHVSKLSRLTADHRNLVSTLPARSDSPLMQAVQASNRLNQVINFLREKQERSQPPHHPWRYNPLRQTPHSVPSSYRYDQELHDQDEDDDMNDDGEEVAEDSLEMKVPIISLPFPFEEKDALQQDEIDNSNDKSSIFPPPPPPLAPILTTTSPGAMDIFHLTSPSIVDTHEDTAPQQQGIEDNRKQFSHPKIIATDSYSLNSSPRKKAVHDFSSEEIEHQLNKHRKRRLFVCLKRRLIALEQLWQEKQVAHKFHKQHMKKLYLHRWRVFKQHQQLHRDRSLNSSYPLYPAAMTLSQGTGETFIIQYALRVALHKSQKYIKFIKSQRLSILKSEKFYVRKIKRAALYEWRIFFVLSRKKKLIARPPNPPPPSVAASTATSPDAKIASITNVQHLPSQISPPTLSVVISRRRSVPAPPAAALSPVNLKEQNASTRIMEDVILSPGNDVQRLDDGDALSPSGNNPPQDSPSSHPMIINIASVMGEEPPTAAEDALKEQVHVVSEDTTIIPAFRSSETIMHDMLPPPLPPSPQDKILPLPTPHTTKEGAHIVEPRATFIPPVDLKEAYARFLEEDDSEDDERDYDGYDIIDEDQNDEGNYDDYDAYYGEAALPSSSPALFIAYDSTEEEDEEDKSDSHFDDVDLHCSDVKDVQPSHHIEEHHPVKSKMSVNAALHCLRALVLLWRAYRLYRRKTLRQGLFYLTQFALRRNAQRKEKLLLLRWHEVQVMKQCFTSWKNICG